jgi:DNA-binding response OmpR family regulator
MITPLTHIDHIEQDLPPKRVLIVEDDAVHRRLVSSSLAGYELDYASDGDMASAQLKKEKYDVVILNLDIPHVANEKWSNEEGFLVLNDRQQWKGTPEVVVTAGALTDRYAQRLREQGIIHILEKPYSLRELRQMVDGLCGNAPGRSGRVQLS